MSRLSALFRPILLLLLIFSAQFQVGLMPAQGAEGGMVMVICSGEGPMMMVLDPATGEFRPAPPSTKKSSCDWAACGLAIEPVQTSPVFLSRVTTAAPVIEADIWRPAHDPRGIWARGPPRLV
ncbi:DUF2946 family protein [Stagnihabitans tardus]|uniref:DUF2946 domain-containing protein n=1 Tax=Stagnihabitans tardus TaxID=2699202 RepID=A0AAE5BV37_9RHOB|nr:DUF2946 family protein [Stagnihabitans tardus]NBZ86763.1 hypothetical protein [Stagnihabitans tardus]